MGAQSTLTLPLPFRRRRPSSSHRSPHHRRSRSLNAALTFLKTHSPGPNRRTVLIVSILLLLVVLTNLLILLVNTRVLGEWRARVGVDDGVLRKHQDVVEGLPKGRFGLVEVPEIKHEGLFEDTKKVVGMIGGEERGRRVLSEVWKVPKVVVKGLSVGLVESLVFRMVYMEGILTEDEGGVEKGDLEGERRERMERLGRLVRGDNVDGVGLEGRARCVFVHVQNGLGNRLRAMGSGIALAKKTARVPVIIWERDAHLSASFGDLFNPTPAPDSQKPEHVLYKNLLIVDQGFPRWKDIAVHEDTWRPYNYMLKDGEDATIHYPLPILGRGVANEDVGLENHVGDDSPSITADEPIQSSAHIYLKTAYVGQTIPRIVTRRQVNAELRRLSPVPTVVALFHSHPVKDLQKAIGVHIRSRGIERDNVGVDTECEYTASGARVTNYWRSRSGMSAFLNRMKHYIRLDRDATFFVAADDIAVTRTLQKQFPGRILSIERECDDRSPICVKYALADLMSLARTRKLLGSHWSSFSEAASRLGGKRVFLSGRDFGKRQMGIWDTVQWHWAKLQDYMGRSPRCNID